MPISYDKDVAARYNIRTSGRRVFRRCLRKWGFQSSMRRNLTRTGAEQNINFWFGSAIHFPMEDFFGFNRFGDPRRAFQAYYDAFDPVDRPTGSEIYYDLGLAMLSYFLEWYPKHNQAMGFETVWLTENNMLAAPFTPGARPAVEESFTLDLGLKVIVDIRTGKIIREYNEGDVAFNSLHLELHVDPEGKEHHFYIDGAGCSIEVAIVPICYHGTFDRIVVDKYGRWWILDYKTAKGADTNKLDTDDQISAYMWAAEQWYQHKIHGFVYLQLTKDVAKPPRRLKNGALSTDKKQKTTYQLYREEVLKDYGAVNKAPGAIIEMLNHLAEQDTPEGDRFIRWDFITRSDAQKISTYNHIMAEARMMIDPDLYLFPNPTRDCIWDCPFRDICIAMDDGRINDAETMISQEYEERADHNESNHDDWQERIKWPDTPLPEFDINDASLRPTNIFNIELPEEYNDRYLEE